MFKSSVSIFSELSSAKFVVRTLTRERRDSMHTQPPRVICISVKYNQPTKHENKGTLVRLNFDLRTFGNLNF